MTDVFVSYKREDQARVEPLVTALRGERLEVWWDRDIPGAERWRSEIERHLESARCVIVCWSEASVGPEGGFVRDEAGRALRRGVLLPILLDGVSPPLGFGEVQAIGLIGWHGKMRDPRIVDVIETARAIVEGRQRPKPKAAAIKARRVVGATGIAALLFAALAFAGDIAGTQRAVCKAPGLREVCAQSGLGGVPTKQETEVFAAAKLRADGDGFRQYLKDYPVGGFADEARSLLAACREVIDESWKPEQRRLPLFLARVETPSDSEGAAQAAARQAGEPESRRSCGAYVQSDAHRLERSAINVATWRCDQRPSGWHCGFDGEAICELSARVRTSREVCR